LNPDISIQLVWPVAAHEAISSRYECIEPAHLFLGILKVAELEKDQLMQFMPERSEVRSIISERDKIREMLGNLDIVVPDKSRPIRYDLRKRIGNGGMPHDG